MPDPTASTIAELDALRTMGERLLQSVQGNRSNAEFSILIELNEWTARAGQALQRLYPHTAHVRAVFDKAFNVYSFNTLHAGYCDHLCLMIGAIAAARHEIQNGLLADLKNLLRAETFADTLEMAEHLLGEGYKDAAAVMIAGVLENALRAAARKHNIALTNSAGKPLTIDPLNVELQRAGAYDQLVKKQITSWANLRNDAAHGDYSKYDAQQVKMMLLFVQKFCSDQKP